MLEENTVEILDDNSASQTAEIEAIKNVVVRRLAERARAADHASNVSDSPHDSVYHNQS